MTTLADLRAALLPTAVPVGDASLDASSLGWVRVMKARVPAFDGLESGDLAIVPTGVLDAVVPGPLEAGALVAALSRARVGGVLLVATLGEETAGDPLRLVEGELTAAAIPTLRVARTDIAALERGVIGLIVNSRAELDRQAGLLEARLEQLALEGAGIEALVAAVAGSLGRAVALEGSRGDALVLHAPPEIADGVAAVAAYHARPRAVALRVPLPGAGGRLGGVALLGERAVSESERVVVGRVARLLALELARDDAVIRARHDARRSEALPAAGPPWVVLLARQRSTGADDDGPEERERREVMRRELRTLAPTRRFALRGDADSLEIRAIVAVDPPGGVDPGGLAIAARLAAFLGRTVASSEPFSSPTERPAAEAAARDTLQAAERLAEPPAVARATRAAAYRLLGDLHRLPDGERHARELLRPLLEGRPDVRREHLATLRAVLDGGGVNEAAAALGVHRNTVAYRLRRIEAITGWHIADPELRLPLGVALRLVQDA